VSYDITFHSSAGKPDWPTIDRYFENRHWYQVTEERVLYENSDTGVYFAIDLQREQSANASPAVVGQLRVNLIRPRFFAYEAAREAEAFCHQLQWQVDDDQDDIGVRERFDHSYFLANWTRSNTSGIRRAMPADARATAHRLPSAALREAWEWNFGRRGLQESLGDDAFVSLIRFAQEPGGSLRSVTVWTDAIPGLMPVTDRVVFVRNALAPKRFLIGQRPDHVSIEWRDLEPQLAGYEIGSTPVRHCRLMFTDRPVALEGFISRLPPSKAAPKFIEPDQILDAEDF
jgi:hypothetical protein